MKGVEMGRFFLTAVSVFCGLALAGGALAAPSEITVDLRLDHVDYVSGERIRAVVDIVNMAPEVISAGYPGSKDLVFVEVVRASDNHQLERVSDTPFVAEFLLKANEGQKLETFLGDHYALRTTSHYLAKPVLVHGGTRYEGQPRAFDVVPGMRVTGAVQLFSNHNGLSREFELVYWNRLGTDHLFLTAHDTGTGDRKWNTTDLGALMKVSRPTLSVMPTGEIVVIHRLDPDNFVRSVFWSVPEGIEFFRRELLQDPETAGSARVREMYRESGGVKPVDRPWWKFW